MSTNSEEGSVDGMPQVRKAAAALAVGVGSFADPRDMQARLSCGQLHGLGSATILCVVHTL